MRVSVYVPLWAVQGTVIGLLVILLAGVWVAALTVAWRVFKDGLAFAGLWSDWWRWTREHRRERARDRAAARGERP